jgi:hypothetical protein
MTDVEMKLYQAFDCRPSALGLGGNPTADGKRAKVDRIHRYYLKHETRVHSVDEMISQVRAEWTAGLGPMASWFMWMAMKFLIKQVVIWLWNYYHSAEGIAAGSHS